MKIAFYAEHLTERGTSIALYDYAVHNKSLLGNESTVIYNAEHPANLDIVRKRWSKEFDLIPCKGFSYADKVIATEGCDLVYVIKLGKRDLMVSKSVPTMVHAVFPNPIREVHGSAYAFVSEWLSDHCSGGRVPWVPHIVGVGNAEQDLRGALGIPDDARVFGCLGGRDSFDIDFVKEQTVPRVLEENDDIWFAFMNIEKFIDHPRAIFLPASVDLDYKAAFISTCDAMIHARFRGETFGLAVAEFSLCGKPVVTFGGSDERAHLEILGETGLVYYDHEGLCEILSGFGGEEVSAKTIYEERFSPAAVMKRFDDHLIQPAGRNGIDGARPSLGLKREHFLEQSMRRAKHYLKNLRRRP